MIREIVTTLRRLAATTDLPEMSATDPGLMTLDEFLKKRNPAGKHHPSDSYDISLARFNNDLYSVVTLNINGYSINVERSGSGEGYVFSKDGTVIGVYHSNTLYVAKFNRRYIPNGFSDGRMSTIQLDIKEVKEVKYPSEYVKLVSDVVKKNYANYPELLQRPKIQNDIYELRAEKPLEKDKGITLVLLNSEGLIVAQASNEWGTTLIVVSREYRGKGLGPVIGGVWYKWNPSYESGGFTNAGKDNAVRIWADRVREYMTHGWYSALVERGDLTTSQVKEITSKLPKRSQPKEPTPEKAKSEVLALIDEDNVSFVLYDSAFITDQNDKYILGYGFFRDSPTHGMFMYRIEYERKYQALATSIALQMAKNDGERIYTGDAGADILEIEGISNVVQDGDYVSLSKDILNLNQLKAQEKRARKPYDPHGEIQTLLLEQADSKWD